MPKTIINLVPKILTRRALASVIQSRQHDQDATGPRPQGTRQRSSFPLALTVGLMTIGVIALASLLQLLFSALG